jgi:hypothetical protein
MLWGEGRRLACRDRAFRELAPNGWRRAVTRYRGLRVSWIASQVTKDRLSGNYGVEVVIVVANLEQPSDVSGLEDTWQRTVWPNNATLVDWV